MATIPTPGQLADTLGELKARQAELAKEVKAVQAALKPHLASGAVVAGDYFQITLSEGIANRLDANKMKLYLTEELLRKCRKQCAYTRFNVNARSEEAA